MSEFTFLDNNQVFGYNQLAILQKYGTDCAITDFSILLGGFSISHRYTRTKNTRKDITGYYWTKTDDGNTDVYTADGYGDSSWRHANERNVGARPAIPYSAIKSIAPKLVTNIFGIREVEYGEYPQTVVNKSYSIELEKAYNDGTIKATGKTYTTDSVVNDDCDTSFQPRRHQEYEYNGKKYIRFVADSNCDGKVLSDGRTIKAGQAYWVCVEPIKWLVDIITDTAVSEKILFAGVQFQNTGNYNGNFDNTNIKQFMDKYFSKEILASKKEIDLSNINLTLLEEEQIFGDKALDIIKKYGVKAKITDLAVVRGGCFDSDEGTGYYWTRSGVRDNDVYVVASDGRYLINGVRNRSRGARPVLPYSSIQSICSNVVRDSNGIPTVMCGEYPQYAASKELQQVLNKELENYSSGFRLVRNRGNCKLKKTGRTYTFDSRKYNDYNKRFSPKVYDEYEYQGKKYIRVKANLFYDRKIQLPQSNVSCKDGDYVWIEVTPVEWIIDEKTNLAIAKNILVAGIRYDDEYLDNDGNFENTEMKEYLNKYMAHDLFQGIQPVMKFETMTEEPKQEVEPEVVEPIEPIEQPIIDEPHGSIFDFFRRKNKVNPNYVSVLKSELYTLSYDILFNVPDGPEKDNLSARFDWVMDYYNNNFNRLNDDKQDLEDLLFREKLNELTLDVKLSIEKSNENTQKRI